MWHEKHTKSLQILKVTAFIIYSLVITASVLAALWLHCSPTKRLNLTAHRTLNVQKHLHFRASCDENLQSTKLAGVWNVGGNQSSSNKRENMKSPPRKAWEPKTFWLWAGLMCSVQSRDEPSSLRGLPQQMSVVVRVLLSRTLGGRLSASRVSVGTKR